MPPIDITTKVSSLPRDTPVLYKRAPSPGDPDPPAYLGVLSLADGQLFWAAASAQIVNGKPVTELRLTPKPLIIGKKNMPTFRTKGPPPDVIRDGCYVAKVVFADDRVSGKAKDMIVMKLQLPGGEVLPCCLT
jgi:hypothetical protein